MTARRSVVVAGALAREDGRAGHAWMFLQYLLGLRRLGFDVLFVDAIDERKETAGAWLRRIAARFELPFALLDSATGAVLDGVSREEAVRFARGSELVLNVNGYLDDEELLDAPHRRVLLDIDPGYLQMWHALGLADVFAGHDAYVTVGENIGSADCSIPTCGLDWITTRQPIVLDQWAVAPSTPAAPFTTVGSWRGAFGPVEYEGVTYGSRVHEFRNIFPLPRLTSQAFELALDIDPAETADLEALAGNDWSLVAPTQVTSTLDSYRDYIGRSAAELMVAKQMYVATRSGWFSDRSACYLARGKPVLALDTGFGDRYPVGEGLLAFSSLEEAVAGVAEIGSAYERHARAARALAEEHFDSDRVLARLLGKLGVA